MNANPQVIAIGHAIVDVLSTTDDATLAGLGLHKGTMTLVDDAAAEKLYEAMGPGTEASGGSAANTAACLASLGAHVRFMGRVGDDLLGRVFAHDIRHAGVRFDTPPSADGPGTGRCLIFVSHDAEKTMCTNLGAGGWLGAADIDQDAVAAAQVVYLEGYLCGKPETEEAVETAMAAARRAGTEVAFSGSDPAWVDLHRRELWALLDRVDILFANEPEALGLSGRSGLDEALDELAGRCPVVAVTLGAEGCVVVENGSRVEVPAAPVQAVVDTTGAGDSFAAGFLYGHVNGLGADKSARLGALAAAEVVSHMGARPLADLAELARGAGLV